MYNQQSTMYSDMSDNTPQRETPLCESFSLIDARDRINNVIELIDVCGAALIGAESIGQERVQRHVAGVLYFFVQSQLKDIELGLSGL